MAVEHFLNRWSPFLSPRLYQYTKLQDADNRKSIRTCTSTASFCKGCGLTVSFIIGPLFFKEMSPVGPVTYNLNAKPYERILRNQIIPTFQRHPCLDRIILQQNGTPPHFAKPVMQLIKRHFGNDRIISHHIPNAWPLRSPDLNTCDFWL